MRKLLFAGLAAAVATAALADNALPNNTIDCSAFQKRPDGNWYAKKPTSFAVEGVVNNLSLGEGPIPPMSLGKERIRLSDFLSKKCGGSPI
jgi:hypothetical protein